MKVNNKCKGGVGYFEEFKQFVKNHRSVFHHRHKANLRYGLDRDMNGF